MSFFDRVSSGLNGIQNIDHKMCPKCGEDMYLARWMSVWTCENCDLCIEFTRETKKKVTRYEKQKGLHKSQNKKR